MIYFGKELLTSCLLPLSLLPGGQETSLETILPYARLVLVSAKTQAGKVSGLALRRTTRFAFFVSDIAARARIVIARRFSASHIARRFDRREG